MQNKPNFRKTKMNVNKVLAKDYENKRLCGRRQNKPNQNQFSWFSFKIRKFDLAFVANDWRKEIGDIPEYKGNQDADSNSYDPPVDLVQGLYYYWRIDEINDNNIWKGDAWQFKSYTSENIEPNVYAGLREPKAND